MRIAGEVKGWEPTRWIEKKRLKEMDRFTEFALGAAATHELHAQSKPPVYVVTEIAMRNIPGYVNEYAPRAQESIKKVEVLDYPELGMEAIYRIEVADFPAFILVDDKGNEFFAQLPVVAS